MPIPEYPDSLTIAPLSEPVNTTVTVPGSKSITNRALVLAALGSPEAGTELIGALHSEDTEVMIDSLRQLGFTIDEGDTLRVRRPAGAELIPNDTADLYVANSGTSMRFLTAMVSLRPGRYRLDGVARMRERPIRDLLDALDQLGVQARSEADNGCPPVIVTSEGWRFGHVHVRSDVSSQFLTGVLLAAPFSSIEVNLAVAGEMVSQPYIQMTVAMLRQWGITVNEPAQGYFHITGEREPGPTHYMIEPDASAASYFWAAAAISGGQVTVQGLNISSLQGDVCFVDALEQMGCVVERASTGITVRGPERLRGIDIDMNAISDTVMTLGAVAVFAEGPTTIRNVGHIRHKETDRVTALATELRKVGCHVTERDDGMTITPDALHGAEIDTYKDHRMAMSLALVGLRVPGVVIRDPGCVAKTYPEFWGDFEKLRKR